MNKLAIMISSMFIVQSLCSPAMAEITPLTATENTDTSGIVSGKAAIKVIGPLHVSEGVVIMKDNEVSILSDASDPIREAELTGQFIHTRSIGEGSNRTIKGVAIFTGGYSIKALDRSAVNESITVEDGTKYVGHIVDASSNLLRIKTSNGITIIPIRKITEISSPRALEFTIAANNETTKSSDTTPPPQNLISFDPTITQGATISQGPFHASTIHRQLAETHLKKRLLTTGLIITGAAACIAIPFGCALFTPTPHY